MCHLRQLVGTYRPVSASVTEDLCSLMKNASISSAVDDHADSSTQAEHVLMGWQDELGNLSALHWLSNNDTDGFSRTLQDWFAAEDDDLVKQDEVEMVLKNVACEFASEEINEEHEFNEGEPHDQDEMEIRDNSTDDGNESLEVEQAKSRIEALNSVNIDESLLMVK